MAPATKLPRKFRPYFWDSPLEALNPQKNYSFIIQRLLDKGNMETAKFIWENYDHKLIAQVLTQTRDFSPRIGNFWGLLLNIPAKQIACLQPHYQAIRQTHWP